MHDTPRWSWNVGIPGELSALGEQLFFGAHHAVPGRYHEAYAAKVAAAINRHPLVRIFAPKGRHFGTLQRTLRLPEHWCSGMTERAGWEMVRAELALLIVVT